MEDTHIIDLYWQRNPLAIEATAQRYGNLCSKISQNILGSCEDAEECVNDSYLALWEHIPPERPAHLRAYLATTVRRLSLDRLKARNTQKRGGGEPNAVLDELSTYLSAPDDVEGQVEARVLSEHITLFLQTLSQSDRTIFTARYWLFMSVTEIAHKTGFSESRIKTSLFRSRNKLRLYLISEGLI